LDVDGKSPNRLEGHITSREKAIPGAPKWLIPQAFWFVGDLHAGGNAYHWRILQFAGNKKITVGAFGICAGITFYPWRTSNRCAGDKFLKNPKNSKKNLKYFKIIKT
jgi:hypothetical protein